jgi:predicted membrane-bound spermidine synthase
MKFIHQREHLNEDDIVVIQASQPCNIRLMSDANFRSFKNGGRHTYHGGAFDRFPAKITVPSSGYWNITLDTVTRRAISVTRKPTLTHSIKIVRRS